MKKTFIILSACLAMLLTGCNSEKDLDINTYDGKGLEFVHFASGSDSWIISEDDDSFTHNIMVGCSYKSDAARTYNIRIGEKTTGKEGVDFELPTKSVTIAAGQYTGTIPVTVLYASTGPGFKLELVLDIDDELISPSYGTSSMISVNTDKITYDWDWLLGNWNAVDKDGTEYAVKITKVDETTCSISNIWESGASLLGTVDFDERTITITGNQYAFHYDGYEADIYFVAVDPAADYDLYDPIDTPVVATLSPSGIEIEDYDFLLVGGPYNGYTWMGGISTSLSR